MLPLTYAVSLLRGIWHGEGWLAHAGDVGILALMFVACLVLSTASSAGNEWGGYGSDNADRQFRRTTICCGVRATCVISTTNR